MIFDIREYNKMLADKNISIVYSGPLWANGIDGLAEMLQRRLEFDELPLSLSQSVFSVFVEQMNNMLMYSAEKEKFNSVNYESLKASKGGFVLGIQDKTYFIQTGNVVTDRSAGILKQRIDLLNTLDKKELRQYYKEQSRVENTNEESKGAGLGLIEIARRATSKIEYEFTPEGEGLSYFTMFVTI